ncbi:hypothetical protein PR048_014891 [Dryococelus australis]|uniref:Uncharacterized protein n=1 Tax=Dryococelus australis TaxID=614101 RepID=A0ABQ9HFF0_9NEOP|nr:hypothetical protein PR048_014891 [Dryococelus australis]
MGMQMTAVAKILADVDTGLERADTLTNNNTQQIKVLEESVSKLTMTGKETQQLIDTVLSRVETSSTQQCEKERKLMHDEFESLASQFQDLLSQTRADTYREVSQLAEQVKLGQEKLEQVMKEVQKREMIHRDSTTRPVQM